MNDQDLERVLRNTGRRARPPESLQRAVRERAHAEWRALVAERRDSRRRAAYALVAGFAAAGIGLSLLLARAPATGEPVGTLAAASGTVEASGGWLGRFRPLATGDPVREGQAIRTAPGSRAAIALAGGVSARLDRGTEVALEAADRLVLAKGALYVDSGAGGVAPPLEIETPSGTVRHVGTQYEVRLLADGVRLRVRDGRVEWRPHAGRSERGRSGEELTISEGGVVQRRPLLAWGPEWDWIADARPPLDLEGRPLAEVIERLAYELGLQVDYASPATREAAADIIVHGSVEGLAPREALGAVLSTTRLQARVADGRVFLEGSGSTLHQPR